jgi:putative radical SAM enzyme (TIGR03279 family)
MAKQPSLHAYPGTPEAPCARIRFVDDGSAADDAGLTAGCVITSVEGHPLRDILDWSWYADGDEVTVGYIDTDGDAGEVDLVRDEGQTWGITFDGAVFDGIRTCRNACLFCFMRQLPDDARDSLLVRDDDWRLSFLQGNFVTMTNLTEEDMATIIERNVSPLRVSLHAVTPSVRERLIGKHAAEGMANIERLLKSGIDMYLQIVLVPGVNDGDELKRTLAWAYVRAGIKGVGIVPLGFTRHQHTFTKSYNDPEDARAVIDLVEPFQEHARQERGYPWVYLADEWYRNAYPDDLLEKIPPAEDYGDFDMFEDGIGIVRYGIEEWRGCADMMPTVADAIEKAGTHVYLVLGKAQETSFTKLVDDSPLKGLLIPLYVDNAYFGGNVDVTGLLCGCDVARAIRGVSPRDYVVLPQVMFNADGVTLDDMTPEDIRDTAGIPVTVVSCSVREYLTQIQELVQG